MRLNRSLVAPSQPRAMQQHYLDFAAGRNFCKCLDNAKPGQLEVRSLNILDTNTLDNVFTA